MLLLRTFRFFTLKLILKTTNTQKTKRIYEMSDPRRNFTKNIIEQLKCCHVHIRLREQLLLNIRERDSRIVKIKEWQIKLTVNLLYI